MADLQDVIARAIKSADRSMFNENYRKQAAAVIEAVRKAGFEIVPLEPSPGLIGHLNDNLPLGRLRPRELVTALYALIVHNARRFDG